MKLNLLADPSTIATRHLADLVGRCARQGWTLRACDEGLELLGLGPRATFGTLDACAAWCERWAAERPAKVAAEQLTFLEAA